MKFFETLLKEYADPGVKTVQLGADETQKATESEIRRLARTIDRKALRRDLESVKKENNRYFLLCVAMVILLFIICIVLVIMARNSAMVTVWMSGFGVSAAGLIKLMTQLWRSKSNTELLLALAINGDDETITDVVNILADSMRKK